MWLVLTTYPERTGQLTDFLAETTIYVNWKVFDFFFFIVTIKCVYTSTKFFSVIISLGKCFNRFLWSSNDLRFFSFAMLVGRFSIKLSHKIRPWSWGKFPTVSGTSVMALPPIDRICKLNKIDDDKWGMDRAHFSIFIQ